MLVHQKSSFSFNTFRISVKKYLTIEIWPIYDQILLSQFDVRKGFNCNLDCLKNLNLAIANLLYIIIKLEPILRQNLENTPRMQVRHNFPDIFISDIGLE